MNNYETIAINLKRFRRMEHLSIDKLAEKSGLSRSTIIRIESAEYNPSVVTLEKIADALNILVTDLLL